MADRYKNFVDLASHETENSDFRVRSQERHGAAAVIAPRGGGIEPGTSELAEAIASPDLSFYAFEDSREIAMASCTLRATVLMNRKP